VCIIGSQVARLRAEAEHFFLTDDDHSPECLMILRMDRLQTELPMPKSPSPRV
jgi:hypothetical protein